MAGTLIAASVVGGLGRMVSLSTSSRLGARSTLLVRGVGVPFKVAVHAPLDAVESRAHTAPEGDPCADNGNDGGQLDQQGIHRVRVAWGPLRA
jgi:hypothetical protein